MLFQAAVQGHFSYFSMLGGYPIFPRDGTRGLSEIPLVR